MGNEKKYHHQPKNNNNYVQNCSSEWFEIKLLIIRSGGGKIRARLQVYTIRTFTQAVGWSIRNCIVFVTDFYN